MKNNYELGVEVWMKMMMMVLLLGLKYFVDWIEWYKLWICDYIVNGDNNIYKWLRLLFTKSGCELSLAS